MTQLERSGSSSSSVKFSSACLAQACSADTPAQNNTNPHHHISQQRQKNRGKKRHLTLLAHERCLSVKLRCRIFLYSSVSDRESSRVCLQSDSDKHLLNPCSNLFISFYTQYLFFSLSKLTCKNDFKKRSLYRDCFLYPLCMMLLGHL